MSNQTRLVNSVATANRLKCLLLLPRGRGLHFYRNSAKLMLTSRDGTEKPQRLENKGPLRCLLDNTFAILKKRSTSKLHTIPKLDKSMQSTAWQHIKQDERSICKKTPNKFSCAHISTSKAKKAPNPVPKKASKQASKRSSKTIRDCLQPLPEDQDNYSLDKQTFTKKVLHVLPYATQSFTSEKDRNMQELSDSLKSYLMPITPDIKRLIAVPTEKQQPNTHAGKFAEAILNFDRPDYYSKCTDERVREYYLENLRKYAPKEYATEPEMPNELKAKRPASAQNLSSTAQGRHTGGYTHAQKQKSDGPKTKSWRPSYHNQSSSIILHQQKPHAVHNSEVPLTMSDIAKKTRAALNHRRNIMKRLRDAVMDPFQIPKY